MLDNFLLSLGLESSYQLLIAMPKKHIEAFPSTGLTLRNFLIHLESFSITKDKIHHEETHGDRKIDNPFIISISKCYMAKPII